MPFVPDLTMLPDVPEFSAPFPAARNAATGHCRSRLPLTGLTVLAVEDSRFASDALRLMCQRSGARLRRAETIRDALAHLRVYRPDILLVDLGLPDGRGEDLIRTMVADPLPVPCLIGMSGDPAGRSAAMAAGAAAFLEKPIPGLFSFQRSVLAALGVPPGGGADDPMALPDRIGLPDDIGLRDDLAQAAVWLANGQVRARPGHLIGFVAGLARQSGDADLLAATDAAKAGPGDLSVLADLIAARLDGSTPFGLPTRQDPV